MTTATSRSCVGGASLQYMPRAVCTSMHISPPGATQVKDKLHNTPMEVTVSLWLPALADFLSDKLPPKFPTRSQLKFLAQNDHHQVTTTTPYKFTASGDMSMHKLEMLLIPNALCLSSRKCNCAFALPSKVQLGLRVTRRSTTVLVCYPAEVGKTFCG